MEKCYLEVCVDSTSSALAAARGGADRLELCANLIIGGTSPSPALFKEIRKHSDIPMHVLLRPRFGDFCYDSYEFEILKEEVRTFRELGAEGIVIGILREDGTLDSERMAALIEEAGEMRITLHRAFDMCRDPREALAAAKALGVDLILTSGQQENCVQGAGLIGELVADSAEAIRIMAGSGMSAAAAEAVFAQTGVRDFHLSGKVTRDSRMKYRKAEVSMGLPSMSEYEIWETEETAVRAMRDLLDRFE